VVGLHVCISNVMVSMGGKYVPGTLVAALRKRHLYMLLVRSLVVW
jgi:hypothetical protein